MAGMADMRFRPSERASLLLLAASAALVPMAVQLETPGHLVGKVIALAMSLANCAQPVGQLVYGGLFDALRVDLAPVALGTAAVSFALALAAWRVLGRGLREIEANRGPEAAVDQQVPSAREAAADLQLPSVREAAADQQVPSARKAADPIAR